MPSEFGCCRGCGEHRDLSHALMCATCVEAGVPVPKIGHGHGDGTSEADLRSAVEMLQFAIDDALTYELPVEPARRLRRALETLHVSGMS